MQDIPYADDARQNCVYILWCLLRIILCTRKLQVIAGGFLAFVALNAFRSYGSRNGFS